MIYDNQYMYMHNFFFRSDVNNFEFVVVGDFDIAGLVGCNDAWIINDVLAIGTYSPLTLT